MESEGMSEIAAVSVGTVQMRKHQRARGGIDLRVPLGKR
jgi:hypothetical protein